MTARSIILGTGGHARVIASFLVAGYGGEVVLAAQHEPTGDEIAQSAFFRNPDDFRDATFYLGIGNNAARRAAFDRLRALGLRVGICVAPTAFVADDAMLEPGVVICAGAVVGSKAVIEENGIVNTLSSVDHDCHIGAHSQITAGVTFGGTVRVGTNCFFGVKSAVIPNINIGNNVQIMAGSIVTSPLPDDVMAGGNPARVVKRLVP